MMEYLRIENDFPRISHSAVTLGKFDGIHRGHQKLVEKIIEQKQEGAQAVVLALGTASRTILTKEERCRILEEMGVDILLECPLTEKIRHMKAENFIKEILIGDLQVSYVAVGEDFRFGPLLCSAFRYWVPPLRLAAIRFSTYILSKRL